MTATPLDDPIPLSLLVLEGVADSVDALAARLDGAVVLDDVGIRCVSRQSARWLIAEKVEAEASQRAHRRRQQGELTRRCAESHAAIPTGIPAPRGVDGVTGLAVLTAADKSARRDAAGQRRDELASGGIVYHPIQEGP